MADLNLKNHRKDRIDVHFRDKKFIEILVKWKELCGRYFGQTKRLQYLITKDVVDIREEIKKDLNL